jgi:hypothetical protein
LSRAIKALLRGCGESIMFLIRGSQGSLVTTLQERLTQLGYDPGPVDGVFGYRTESAVLKFQQEKGVDADGVVGNQTWQALFGTSIPEPVSDLDQPPLEQFCFDIFGDFRLAGWNEQSLARCDLSAFRGELQHIYFGWLTPQDRAFVHANWFGFTCHRLVVPKFRMAFENVVRRGFAGQLKTFNGCYDPRFKRGGNTWSAHSWGIAIDINAPWNAFGQSNFEMSRKLAQCFKNVGFIWGGDWSYPDAMHFQYCRAR